MNPSPSLGRPNITIAVEWLKTPIQLSRIRKEIKKQEFYFLRTKTSFKLLNILCLWTVLHIYILWYEYYFSWYTLSVSKNNAYIVGLRGAIAFALSLHLEFDSPEKRYVIVTTTLIIVLFTILFLGGATMPIMKVCQRLLNKCHVWVC